VDSGDGSDLFFDYVRWAMLGAGQENGWNKKVSACLQARVGASALHALLLQGVSNHLLAGANVVVVVVFVFVFVFVSVFVVVVISTDTGIRARRRETRTRTRTRTRSGSTYLGTALYY